METLQGVHSAPDRAQLLVRGDGDICVIIAITSFINITTILGMGGLPPEQANRCSQYPVYSWLFKKA